MIWWILGIVGWLTFGAAAYFSFRHNELAVSDEWTVGERRWGLLFLACGPSGLLAVFAIWMLTQDDERPAKW